MSAVGIRGLSKRYGDIEVLRQVDLDISKGNVLALLGPSGCGKTTLLRLLAGFDRPDEGTIAFEGRAVVSPSLFVPPERRGIGYVPQEGSLFPHLSVSGNIAYGLPRRERRRDRIAHVLDLTGLTDLAERFPHELSGGQQQRVALARALAPDPALILLDEPFNALDLDLRRSMCEDVADLLRRTRSTAVLVTHDPGEAFAVADRVAVMQAGRIMQSDRPEIVYWCPGAVSIARLTGACIFLAGESDGTHAVTVFGRLPLYAVDAQARGQAWIMLRPEQVRLMPEGQGTEARVAHNSFRGDHAFVTLEAAGGHRLALRMPSLTAPPSGARVFLAVEGHCMAFPGSHLQEATHGGTDQSS